MSQAPRWPHGGRVHPLLTVCSSAVHQQADEGFLSSGFSYFSAAAETQFDQQEVEQEVEQEVRFVSSELC